MHGIGPNLIRDVIGSLLVIAKQATEDRSCSSGVIAWELEIAPRRMEAPFRKLVRAGILIGDRGPWGGYRLVRDPDTITLLQVHRALYGVPEPRDWPHGTSPNEIAERAMQLVDRATDGVLKRTTLASLLREVS